MPIDPTGGTSDELKKIFDRLSNGLSNELLEKPRYATFGTYGRLADQYGVHWFFQRGERGENG